MRQIAERACAISALVVMAACASTGSDGGRAGDAWQAVRQADPVTGVTRCVVTAPDHLFGGAYSSSARLYPFVEKNSEAGLLVGVSSGGKYRIAPGDIVWRVDQNPPRTLTMAQTPVIGTASGAIDVSAMPVEQQQAYQSVMDMTAGMTSSIQNGITAVGGKEAEAVLAEMRGGANLLFRAAAAAPNAGLPSDAIYEVGQSGNGKTSPIPLDASFRTALEECGV